MSILTLAHALNGSEAMEFFGHDFSGQQAEQGSFSKRTFVDCLFGGVTLGPDVEVCGGRVCISIGDNAVLRDLVRISTPEARSIFFMNMRQQEDYGKLPLRDLSVYPHQITALTHAILLLGEGRYEVNRFMSLPMQLQQDEFLLALGVRFAYPTM